MLLFPNPYPESISFSGSFTEHVFLKFIFRIIFLTKLGIISLQTILKEWFFLSCNQKFSDNIRNHFVLRSVYNKFFSLRRHFHSISLHNKFKIAYTPTCIKQYFLGQKIFETIRVTSPHSKNYSTQRIEIHLLSDSTQSKILIQKGIKFFYILL